MSARAALHRSILFVAALLFAATAQAVVPAGLFRAYLASTGSDTNDCTRPTPCRLLPAALAAVADGGEIWMLDSANYNAATVTIGKSVSILAVPGAVGSVVATGGPAISIAADNLKVALRNLVIVPLAGGGGTDGVFMTGASTLFIENSLIANLPNYAVNVVGAGKVKVTNSIIRNNAGYAVYLQNGASGEISGTQMLANGNGGVYALGTTATSTMASVNDSVISGGSWGVFAFTGIAGATAKIFVTRSTIESTNYALDCETTNVGSALVTVSGSTITYNLYAWYQSGTGSVIESSGNNHIRGNTNTFGALTNVGLQ
jgi:hypothetical protein